MVERLKINQLYVSTSAVKQLMKCDVKHIRDHDLSSLRTIATGSYSVAITTGPSFPCVYTLFVYIHNYLTEFG